MDHKTLTDFIDWIYKDASEPFSFGSLIIELASGSRVLVPWVSESAMRHLVGPISNANGLPVYCSIPVS